MLKRGSCILETMFSSVRLAPRFRVFARPSNPHRRDADHRLSGTRHSNFLRLAHELLPGTIYGYDANKYPSQLICSRRKDVETMLRDTNEGFSASVFNLKLEDGSRQLAIPRDLAVHPVHGYPISLNWLRYDPDVGVNIPVPIKFEDYAVSPGIKRGGVFRVGISFVWVHVKGDQVPLHIPVSLKDLDVGEHLCWHHLDIPENVRLTKRNKLEKNVVLCSIKGKYSLIKAIKDAKEAKFLESKRLLEEEQTEIMRKEREMEEEIRRTTYADSQKAFISQVLQK